MRTKTKAEMPVDIPLASYKASIPAFSKEYKRREGMFWFLNEKSRLKKMAVEKQWHRIVLTICAFSSSTEDSIAGYLLFSLINGKKPDHDFESGLSSTHPIYVLHVGGEVFHENRDRYSEDEELEDDAEHLARIGKYISRHTSLFDKMVYSNQVDLSAEREAYVYLNCQSITILNSRVFDLVYSQKLKGDESYARILLYLAMNLKPDDIEAYSDIPITYLVQIARSLEE